MRGGSPKLMILQDGPKHVHCWNLRGILSDLAHLLLRLRALALWSSWMEYAGPRGVLRAGKWLFPEAKEPLKGPLKGHSPDLLQLETEGQSLYQVPDALGCDLTSR